MMLSDSPGDGSLEAFELCLSVWSLVLSHCPPKEVGEVQRVLGASFIEQAADLREEVSTLLEIWRQYREEQTTDSPLPSRHLAEPPELRQRLVQEIIFFVDYLKKKSKQDYIKQDKNGDILRYVEGEAVRSGQSSYCDSGEAGSCVSVGSRPLSAVSSQDGRETPLRPLTPGSQDGSQVSVLAERSECVNAMDIDFVISHLRQALKKECAQHQMDIEFLQSCLEGEQARTEHTQPTIKELRTFGTQLEHAILDESRTTPQPPIHPAKSKLPPLLTLQPRPPSKANCGSQAPVTRASQVRKKDSKHKTYTKGDINSPMLNKDTDQDISQYRNGSEPSSTEEQCRATGCDNQLHVHTDLKLTTHTEKVCDHVLSHSARSSQPRTRDCQLELTQTVKDTKSSVNVT